MKRITPFIALLGFLCSIAIPALAQKKNITGKITDAATGTPLPGVSIKIKGGGGTESGSDGTFTISAGAGDVITFSSVGYTDQSVTIGSATTLEIKMQEAYAGLEPIIMVGSRSGGRVRTESAVPVDVISINQVGQTSARMDLTSQLNYAAPSFNYNKQSGADGADHIDLGTLRGLGPDQTLVLINGKRRHQTAFVTLFGTRGRGNSGADLNSFPEAAVDHIEILRDGASAQYGSDAIAGVINIILKKDVNRWNINAGWSGYADHKYNSLNSVDPTQYYTGHQIDGGTFNFSANNGFAIGKNGGFINISLDFARQNKTFRQEPDTNLAKNPEALPINSLRRAFGDGSLTSGGAMYNMEIPFAAGSKTTFYSFGGYNYKASDAYAYTRNDDNPSRFPVDANGDIIKVPSIMHTSSDGVTFYNPHIQTHIIDYSVAAGIKGVTQEGWNWDISNTLGQNNFHFFGDKTFNASMIGKTSPNHFDDGGFTFLQNTLNADFDKSFKGIGEGFNVGLGAEFRYEHYGIYAGEDASWMQYPNDLGQAAGSQGFPGFRPADEVSASRTNVAGYADVEANITKRWMIDIAARFENYSDFGFVNTSKLATRYKLTDNFNLRGSVSTGYRAPSLQQMNFSNTLTTFVGDVLEEEKVARNDDPITKAAGIPKLKQETSTNGSIGFAWKMVPGLTLTVDGYLVKVKDRIVLSGLFSADDPTLPAALTSQLQNLKVAFAQFFDNAVNTTNKGVDIVLDYKKNWGKNGFKALFAGNIQGMHIDAINVPAELNDSYVHRKTFFSDREEAFLKASAPKSKFSLNLEYSYNKFAIGTHLTYFGEVKLLGFGWTGLASATPGGPGDPNISGSFTGIDPYVDIDGYSDQVHVVPEVFDYKAKVTTDIYASYKLCKSATLFIGADNLFNVHPSLGAVPNARLEAFDNESGGAWDSVQMGFNGLRLFGKLAFSF